MKNTIGTVLMRLSAVAVSYHGIESKHIEIENRNRTALPSQYRGFTVQSCPVPTITRRSTPLEHDLIPGSQTTMGVRRRRKRIRRISGGLGVVLPEERRILYRAAGGLALDLKGQWSPLEYPAALLLLLLLQQLLLLEVHVERIGSRKGVRGRMVCGV